MAPFSVLLALLMSAILQQGSSITCFVPNTSLDRREATLIVPGRSEIACQALCINDATCTAIQITKTGNCVIFGAVITPTFGQCPTPFTCQIKTNGPPCVPTVLPCGPHAAGNRTVFIDALLHDGTNYVFENYNNGHMDWDVGLGSWFAFFRDDPTATKYYFLAAKCVRPPVTPPAGCECEELPLDLPVVNNAHGNPKPVAKYNAVPMCPSWVQMRFLHLYETGMVKSGAYGVFNIRFVFCANKQWIQVYENPNFDGNYIVSAASCVD